MKKLRSLMSILLVLSMLFCMNVGALAAESNKVISPLKPAPELTIEQKEALGEWVTLDSKTNMFSIKKGAEKAISKTDYKLLKECIDNTNLNIKISDFSTGEVFVVSPEEDLQASTVSSRGYIEGVTKIEWHWWGARIYISKTDLHRLGTGLAIGCVWIPGGVITNACATLGILAGTAPGGIVFNVNGICLASLVWSGYTINGMAFQ